MLTNLPHLALAVVDSDLINLPDVKPTDSTTTILQIVFGFGVAISLLVITIAGLRMVLSQGNPDTTNKARNTILYAAIGLAVCAFSFSIVTFVVNRV